MSEFDAARKQAEEWVEELPSNLHAARYRALLSEVKRLKAESVTERKFTDSYLRRLHLAEVEVDRLKAELAAKTKRLEELAEEIAVWRTVTHSSRAEKAEAELATRPHPESLAAAIQRIEKLEDDLAQLSRWADGLVTETQRLQAIEQRAEKAEAELAVVTTEVANWREQERRYREEPHQGEGASAGHLKLHTQLRDCEKELAAERERAEKARQAIALGLDAILLIPAADLKDAERRGAVGQALRDAREALLPAAPENHE